MPSPLLDFGFEPSGPFYGLSPIERTPREISEYLASLERSDVQQLASPDLETSSLHALCNASAPINRIPAHVLVGILVVFAPSIPPAPPSDARHAWVPFMRVCRHWCALIRGTPSFWLNIVVGRSTQWMEFALPRTRSAPFNLRTTPEADHSVVFRALQEHAGHIAGLHLNSALRVDPSKKDAFAPLHSMTLPSLVTLILFIPEYPVPIHREESYPRLTSLIMTGKSNTLTWRPSVVAGLRTISLSSCQITAPVTITEFVNVLRAAVHLESINLYSFLHKALLPNSYAAPTGDLVTLPNLRKLKCTDYPHVIGQLTSHLRLPSAGDIELKGWSRSTRRPEDHKSFFPSDGDRANAAFFQSMTEAEIYLWDGFSKLICRTPELSVTLSLEEQYTSWEDEMGLVISQFTTNCCGSPLTSIALKGMPCHVPRATWDALFDHFDGLQNLTLTVEHYGFRGQPLPFPDELFLSLATPSARNNGEKHLDILLACLQARYKAGASKLETLSIAPIVGV
ncbi:hypothetical protein C8Q79DRAFT_986968 [Trametes meyenii]|nr:hypothetical protein C8Q79DRAFT_986968 [Trametes meyenii]